LCDSTPVKMKCYTVNVGKSLGPDAIHHMVLTELLAEIVIMSMQEGTIPEDWKLDDL
jgi:hypothetical protein